MNRVPVELDDPRLAPYRNLPRRRAARAQFVVEGEIAVLRLLRSKMSVESVVVTPSRLERIAPVVPFDVPLLCVDAEALRSLAGFHFHRGCLACAHTPSLDTLDPEPKVIRLLSNLTARIVVAERLADPVNVGSLLRNCYAFGVDLVVLDGKGADPWSRRAIRASMGSVFDQPLAIASDLTPWVASLAARLQDPWRMLATTVDPDATPIGAVDPSGPWVLLVGNEGDGLSSVLRTRATLRVTIPLHRDFDSLNVAAATAIFLDRLCPR